MSKFAEQVGRFIDKYDRRLNATIKYSVQETVEKAQTTVGAGGRMRVKTGFLRASIQAAIGRLPSGPTRGDEDGNYPEGTQVAGESLSAVLLRWNPQDIEHLFVGWTANYARIREYNDGFLRGATEQWNYTVSDAVKRVKAEIR